MFKSMICLVMASVMCLHAVQVKNNTPYDLTLGVKVKNDISYKLKSQTSSYISGIEKDKETPPFILEPAATFSSHGNITRFEIHANGKSRVIENIGDNDCITVKWSNDDLAIEHLTLTT